MISRLPAVVVVAVTLLAAGGAAHADDFFQTSPGPLAESHASLDGQDNCNACHVDGKPLSNAKCLGCHDHSEQKAKIDAGRGFHSTAKIAGRTCWTCHLEHKGKGYDIMGWAAVGGRDRFDHRMTDYQLTGKHVAVACDDCHQRRNRQGLRLYLGESRVCGGCHKGDQPHNFERAEMMKCDRCHTDVAWKPPRREQDFDHDDRSQASFPLEGSHADVACAKCHPKAEFNLKKDVSQCSACHPNPHTGHLYGETRCDFCHSPRYASLKKFEFDHDKRTKFKIDGGHKKANCTACHPAGKKQKPKKACESCHARDSRHGDRFAQYGKPPACATCHPTSRWEPELFNHDKRTKFKLTGSHATAGCRDCHRGQKPNDWERFNPATVGCMGCHQHATVHKGKFKDSECLRCHKAPGSMQDARGARERFHGADSKFPLLQAHARVECQKCHKGNQWKGLSTECGAGCHEDSLHRGALGDRCTRCHTGGVWQATGFSHDQDSSYQLIGMHLEVKCEPCHPNRLYKPTPTSCGAARCHLDDDAHERKLGTKCERCHRETGQNVFQHNQMAAFKLVDKHLKVACKKCHPSVQFKPRPRDCVGCHPDPEIHRGQYGTACDECHDAVSWKRIKPVHDVGNFSLAGSHDGVDCRRCHQDSRPLGGTGNVCVGCHRSDDVHANSLGPRCGQCHTQWAFAPARFDHTTVGCDLSGQHRTLPCFDCHKSGAFGGLVSECYGCHRDDAAAQPTHQDAAHFGCGACHSVNFWENPNTSPAGTNSVCR